MCSGWRIPSMIVFILTSFIIVRIIGLSAVSTFSLLFDFSRRLSLASSRRLLYSPRTFFWNRIGSQIIGGALALVQSFTFRSQKVSLILLVKFIIGNSVQWINYIHIFRRV